MSTDTPTGAADGPHLDHEASSAALDGEATAGEVAHLAGCDTCQADVASLRALQSAVASPVELDGSAREMAISAALAAFEPGANGRPVTPSELLALRDRRRPVGRRSADLAPWLGLAAVLLLLVLGVSQLDGLGGEDDEDSATAAGDAGQEDSVDEGGDAASAGGGATSAAPAAPVDVGDLGPLAQGADLRAVVDRALGPATGSGPGGAGTEQEEAAGPDDEPTTLAPEPSASEAEEDRSSDGSTRAAIGGEACEAVVRDELPEAGALLLTGTATIEGAAGIVYGFAAPTERPGVLVTLVRTEGCQVITFQSYARS